jgi:hypothetical protein
MEDIGFVCTIDGDWGRGQNGLIGVRCRTIIQREHHRYFLSMFFSSFFFSEMHTLLYSLSVVGLHTRTQKLYASPGDSA